MKTFKNLKEIKNRDEFIKICEYQYGNGMLRLIEEAEEIEIILPTEIINNNLDNKFIDFRFLTKSDKIYIVEGQTNTLRDKDMTRYYDYSIDTYCRYMKEVKTVIICLSESNNLKKLIVNENVCFRPKVIELKKIDGTPHLKKIKHKLENEIEFDDFDCLMMVYLPLLKLKISEADAVREICSIIKKIMVNNLEIISEEDKLKIIPAMYLNIAQYIENEEEQEKLLEDVNMLKYCENALDKKIREAKEEVIKTKDEEIKTKDEKIKTLQNEMEQERKTLQNEMEQGIQKIAKKLLNENLPIEAIHKITNLDVKIIENLNK